MSFIDELLRGISFNETHMTVELTMYDQTKFIADS